MKTRLKLVSILFLLGLMTGYLVQAQDELSVTLVQANGSLTGLPGKKLFWIEKNGLFIQSREEGIRINDPHNSPVDFIVSTAKDLK